MLNRLFTALAALIAFFTTSKETIKNLKAEIAARDQIITDQNANIADLHQKLDEANSNDEPLKAALEVAKQKQAASEEAQAAAEASLAELNTGLADATAKAEDAVTKINDDPAVPITVAEDGTVTHDTTAPVPEVVDDTAKTSAPDPTAGT